MPDQEFRTFAEAASAAQRERPKQGKQRGRPVKTVCIHGLTRALHAGLGDPKVVTSFGTASGLRALEGRQVVLTVTHAELAGLLRAIPPRAVPEDIRPALAAVAGWLEGPPE